MAPTAFTLLPVALNTRVSWHFGPAQAGSKETTPPSPPLTAKIFPPPSQRKPVSSRPLQSLCSSEPSGVRDVMFSSKDTSTRAPPATTLKPRGHFRPVEKVSTSHGAASQLVGIACTLKFWLSATSTRLSRQSMPPAKAESSRGPLPGGAPPSTTAQPAVQSFPAVQPAQRSTPVEAFLPPNMMKSEPSQSVMSARLKAPWSPSPKARSTSTKVFAAQLLLSLHQGSKATTWWFFKAASKKPFQDSKPP
mmetsp:Transcript_49623/g.118149  ORF Transcript_49623/g.118149 Transcript_49623/m.118149 type:complete len:249 (+) Transcript_49623:23-769(+)